VHNVAEQAQRPLEAGEIRLRVHGRQRERDGDLVPGSVFAQKLLILLRGLRAADAAVNGKVKYDYVISDLRIGSALVELREEEIREHGLLESRSGISAFDDCVDAIRQGSVERALSFGRCPVYVSQLAKGSGRRFGYAELWIADESPLRVDEFLLEQTEAVIEGPERRIQPETSRRWYKGITRGAFEGEVKEVDLRGAIPEIKLILSAGGKELDCVFRDVDVERIREALNRRVRVEGTAYYDGRSGLPRRVEVRSVESVVEPGDFTRWRGAFETFVPPEWEDDL
jgi:hypothetical protein